VSDNDPNATVRSAALRPESLPAEGLGGRSRRAMVLVLLLCGLAVLGYSLWPAASVRAQRRLNQAYHHYQKKELAAGERFAVLALELDPANAEAAVLAAECATPQGRYLEALSYLARMNTEDKKLRFKAAGLRGRVNGDGLKRLGEAIRAYEEVLELQPRDIEAHSELAEILGATGQRRAAIPHVMFLLELGAQTPLSILLAREDGGLDRPEFLKEARQADPDDPVPLVGMAWRASNQGESDQALELLKEALALTPGFEPALVALGKEHLARQDFPALLAWYDTLPEKLRETGDIWAIRAEIADHLGDAPGAIRCYWEAARQIPELMRPHVRLPPLLTAAGRPEIAAQFATRLETLVRLKVAQDRVLVMPSQQDINPIIDMALACEEAGRMWEAMDWARLAVSLDPAQERPKVILRRQFDSGPRPAPQITVDDANVALQVDLSDFPVPVFPKSIDAVPPVPEQSQATPAFRDDAATAGLEFTYFNGCDPPTQRKMYEFTGGGIGVIDFDRDGFPDLAHTQACRWPPVAAADGPADQLHRNDAGRAFVHVTPSARIVESEFGQGLAVGDVNADGFPDLFVANIGANRLWVNRGDGTFEDGTVAAGISGEEWSTSCLFGDLDGDRLPDLYVANYLQGDDLFERVCEHPEGGAVACLPIHFDAAPDELWRNNGDGTFADAAQSLLGSAPLGKGLGVAAWDADGSGRLSLFVANDTDPNFYFVPSADEASERQYVEQGLLSGLAVNGRGKAEGCMGVTLADFDGNGVFDVHVTNFLQEQNTVWLGSREGLYEDATERMGLAWPTRATLGFGTLALDADLDGAIELFDANGHVDDLRDYDRPYRMRPQYFRCDGDRFAEAPSASLGPYFEQEWLARPAARLDWNGDLRDDIVVGHLYDPTALLTNDTANPGRALVLELVGTESERDAFGATVTVEAGGRTQVRQITAGESYQSSHQRHICFGFGEVAWVDRISIHWPSGRTQDLASTSIPGRLLVVEGEAPLAMPFAAASGDRQTFR
jgi:tetratricopeptide (TPR) repeat protein